VQGYELLDDVNGFSVTSEMYNASYWRAKEGELTRTIQAIPGITSVRVHIGASLRSGFSRSQPAQTASVTIATAYALSQEQAEAIQYLVALAVSGLNPKDVAVIDPSKGILAGPKTDKGAEPAVAAADQASSLEQKITGMLEARVGIGNARVSVSVDVSRERQLVSTVAFDPESKVVRSRTTSDAAESGSGGGGALTVASNLPQEEGAATSGASSNTSKNSSENVAYEINETRTEVEKLPGQIERISIAVLLNEQSLGIDPAAADAATIREKMISDLQALVTSGAGLNMERGDSISVELMPFQEAAQTDMVPAPGMIQQLVERYLWSGLQSLLLGVVVIALAFGVVRPMLSPKNAGAVLDGRSDKGSGAGAAAGGSGASPDSDPFNYLKDYAKEREDETAALLQQWLNEDQKVAVNE
jgi:flagellar M-ring protein FliF